MNKQFVLKNLLCLSISEIAVAIREGIVSLDEIKSTGLVGEDVLQELYELIGEMGVTSDNSALFSDPRINIEDSCPSEAHISSEAPIDVDEKKHHEEIIIDYAFVEGDGANDILPIPNNNDVSNLNNIFPKNIFLKNKSVFAALYAPISSSPQKWIRIQLHLYNEEDAKLSYLKATSLDKLAEIMEYNSLSFQLQSGMQVKAELSLYDSGVQVPRTTHFISWNGKLTSVVFSVKVTDPSLTSLAGEVMLSVEDVPLGVLSFTIDIVNSDGKDNLKRIGNVKSFKKVFISYSHDDIKTAEVVASVLRAQSVPYFYDHHSLESGSVFNEEIMNNIDESDLFLLLWSENAAKSDYVEKEYLHAMQRAYPQVQPRQKASIVIKPYIIDPLADPPPMLKDIYNFSSIHS